MAIEFSPKQTAFLHAVLGGEYLYLAYGGGIVSGKSFAGIGALIALCRVYPGSRWAIVRKDLPTIRRNTIPTIERLRPPDFMGGLHQDTWSYRCTNGSEIVLFPESLKEDPHLNRWKGLNVNGFLFDEGNECSVKAWNKGIERAGSWIVPSGEQPAPLLLATFNPNDEWPRAIFYEPHMAGSLPDAYHYTPATIFDNPHAPADYVESLKNLPPDEYNRFVLGKWDINTKPNQLIHPEWIWGARETSGRPRNRWKIGADIAREGDDSTVFMLLNGDNLVEWQEHRKLTTDKSGDYLAIYASDPEHPVNASDIFIDAVGLGAGTFDHLRYLGWNVQPVLSGDAAIERLNPDGKPASIFKFGNLRSQMWWEFREKLRTGMFSLPNKLPERLVSDLTAITYEIKGDKEVIVTPKKKIKELIGRSPDFGDALVYGAFDWPSEPALPSTPVASFGFISPFDQ